MRTIKINNIRKKLKKNQVSLGTWQQIPHSSISEILGKSGYDWIVIDLEHGSIAINQLPDLFRAIEMGGALPLVRISQADPKECKQALDAGAGGIIAPMINNAGLLKSIRSACCWPPSGKRGVGFSRANLFGKNFDDYNKEAQSPLLIAQIEHIDALKCLEEILHVKGLDGIIIGPYDLSASMGMTAEFDNKKFISTMDNILSLCKKSKIPCGIHIVQPDSQLLKNTIDKGYTFIGYATDGVFLYTSSPPPNFD